MQVHNYKPNPITRYKNRFHIPTSSWRNHAHNLSFKSVTDTHTTSTFLGHPGGRWNPSFTKLGMVNGHWGTWAHSM